MRKAIYGMVKGSRLQMLLMMMKNQDYIDGGKLCNIFFHIQKLIFAIYYSKQYVLFEESKSLTHIVLVSF